MEKKEQGTVQALERGLKILELLMQANGRQRDRKMPGHHAVSGVSDIKDTGGNRLELPDVG